MRAETINVVACGRFHYPKYLQYLDQAGRLECFYYSHKLGRSQGLPPARRRNLWRKEYLLYAAKRLFGRSGYERVLPACHRLWQQDLARAFRPARHNLFLLHGNCGKAMAMAKNAGCIVIGEAVNAHPLVQAEVLQPEYAKLGQAYTLDRRFAENLQEELRLTDFLLSPSSWVTRSFVQQGYPAARVIELPYGIDTVGRRPGGDSTATRVLCVGQIMPRKGQRFLLDAVRSLNQAGRGRGFSLTLVGDPAPAYMAHLKATAVPFEHVRHVRNEDMLAFMRNYDLLVLPSLEDGFGVVVTEAIAAGLPVVATTNSGAADVVTAGGFGRVVPAGDSAALASAIESLGSGAETPASRLRQMSWRHYASALCDRLDAATGSGAG